MRVALPNYPCPYVSCDGDGWTVDLTSRTAARCKCMAERIADRNKVIAERLTPNQQATTKEEW